MAIKHSIYDLYIYMDECKHYYLINKHKIAIHIFQLHIVLGFMLEFTKTSKFYRCIEFDYLPIYSSNQYGLGWYQVETNVLWD